MEFAGRVWRLLVGIKDALALLLLLVFFLFLYAAMTASPGGGATTVKDGALLLRLDGALVEEPQAVDPFAQLLSAEAPMQEYRTRDVVHALRAAARDDRIKAVVLDLSRFTGGGLVNLQEVGDAIDEVRAAKKPVLAHAMGYYDDSLLLAAHASEVWVDPLGGAFVLGPGGNRLYFAGLLERLNVTAHIFRVGTFKSAVEPFLLSGQSEPARENAQALYSALWAEWQADYAKARPKANLALVTKEPARWIAEAQGDAARAAVSAGLADRIGSWADFGRRVAEVAGADDADKRPGAFAHTSLRAWLAANPEPKDGKAIGVVTVAGEIVDGEAGPGTAGGERIAALLDEGLERDFAAIVLRVDSPGGSITASEQIREALMRYKAKGVPVVVSMGNVAASGGYWVATPAERIFAEPATITGSIGVFALFPTFERTLAGYGVTSDGVRTTPLSGQPDFTGGLSPEISAMIQSGVESSYGRFLGLVAKARGKTSAQVDAIAQGRVWDGGTARQQGLVDQFGGLDDALAYAAGRAKLGKGQWHAEYLGHDADPYGSLLSRLQPDEDSAPSRAGQDWIGQLASRRAALTGQAISDAGRLAGMQGVQAFCLECPATVARPLDRAAGLGLLERAGKALGLM